ncbi:hypothetical protein FQR65_LT13766 [Abscondita terminalis]|nr:hypothetical protein FQR65_LT13766 [Abscondita terminalis]
MDSSLYTRRGNGLSLEKLLQALEENNVDAPLDIYAIPPEDDNDTDVDEDLSDDEHVANLNCLGPKMLKTTCEVGIRKTSQATAEEPTPSSFQWDSSDEEPLSKQAGVNPKK